MKGYTSSFFSKKCEMQAPLGSKVVCDGVVE